MDCATGLMAIAAGLGIFIVFLIVFGICCLLDDPAKATEADS